MQQLGSANEGGPNPSKIGMTRLATCCVSTFESIYSRNLTHLGLKLFSLLNRNPKFMSSF
jgi:hypothetical protein